VKCPWDHRIWSWLHTITFPDTRNKNTYGLWVGISIVFKTLEHFWCKGNGTITYGHDHYTIKSSLTQGTSIWFMGGISIVFNISEHLRFIGYGTTPYGMVMTYIPSDATWHKNIYGLGVRISMVFERLGHFLFQRGPDPHIRSWLTHNKMLLDTRNKNIIWFRGGVSQWFMSD
jgi:hypothetical protein